MNQFYNRTIRPFIPDPTRDIPPELDEVLHKLALASCGRDEGLIHRQFPIISCYNCLGERSTVYTASFVDVKSHFINIGKCNTYVQCNSCQRFLTRFKPIIECSTCLREYTRIVISLSDHFYNLFDPTTYTYVGSTIYRDLVTMRVFGPMEE